MATDAQDHLHKGIAHAADLHGLGTLRAGLREQVLGSPVFDAPRFAGAFEAAQSEMWARWCQIGLQA